MGVGACIRVVGSILSPRALTLGEPTWRRSSLDWYRGAAMVSYMYRVGSVVIMSAGEETRQQAFRLGSATAHCVAARRAGIAEQGSNRELR